MKRGTAHFDKEQVHDTIDGVPLEELALQLEISDCSRCGENQDDGEGGAILNIRVEEGVLKGDMVCFACMGDDANFADFMEAV